MVVYRTFADYTTDGKSRADSKKVLTLEEAQKAKKLKRSEIFAGRPPENLDLIGEIYLYIQ